MTEEVGTHAIAERIRSIQERAAALNGDPVPSGTVEVGTAAVTDALAVVEEQIANAPSGEPVNLGTAEERLAEQHVSYMTDGSFYNWFYDDGGAAADTPIVADWSDTGLTPENFVLAFRVVGATSVEDISNHTTVTGTDEVTISVDTTGDLVLIFWLHP